MTNQDLIYFLKHQNKAGAGFIDQIKISYRPMVCPFLELLESLPQHKSVFDVGCGSGMFLSLVKEFRKPAKMAGIEISETLINNAKKVLGSDASQVDLRVFDGQVIPDMVSAYDYIYMIDVFHHIPPKQQWRFLDQLFNKMKVGAKLVFKDIEGAHPLKYWNKIHDLLLAGEIGNEIPSRKFAQYLESKENLITTHFSKKRMLLYPHFTFEVEKMNHG